MEAPIGLPIDNIGSNLKNRGLISMQTNLVKILDRKEISRDF